jgi:hypothetical protein
MNRREFFGGVASRAAVLAAPFKLSTAISRSDPGVPARLDARTHRASPDLEIFQHGQKLRAVVMYDLHEDMALIYRTTPDGQIVLIDDMWNMEQYDELRGGITVRFERKGT